MNKLKIGDRVKVISALPLGKASNVKIIIGMTGTVKELGRINAGIEFDDYVNGHSGILGIWEGKEGHCWNVGYKLLKKIEETDTEEETKTETVEQKTLKVLREEIGIEIGEEFDVYEKGEKKWTCRFEKTGFFRKGDDGIYRYGGWEEIVYNFCKYTFKRKQVVPKFRQEYFYLDTGDIGEEFVCSDAKVATLTTWTGDIRDYGNLALGNVYRSEEEALSNKDKLLEKLEKLRKGE